MDPAFESGHWGDATVPTGTAPDSVTKDDLDTLFDVLASEQRRHTLQYLAATETTVPLSELADHVATAVSATDDQTVAIDLHHRHLPKLAAEGLVSYDVDANLTTVTDAGRRVDTARASLAEGEA